jgi:hypothetical protein
VDQSVGGAARRRGGVRGRGRQVGGVGGQVCEHPVAVAGGGLRGRDAGGAMVAGRRCARARAVLDRRWRRTWAAAGGAGRAVQLGLIVNGPAGRGNREKLYFQRPIRVSAAR